VNGAMYFAYMFRGESQESNMMQSRYEQEIKQMRSLYINRYDYIRSTVRNISTTSVRAL